MPKTIHLPDNVVAVVLDLVEALNSPTDDDGFMLNLRRAAMLQPLLEQAFDEVGIDPDRIDRPDIPRLVPGSGWKG